MVTRSLGLQYLWIDALCIVQDDFEDWNKESAIMGRIYTNSHVALVALQGESCHDGFLDRTTARKVPIYYKSSLKPHINSIYWLRQVSGDYAYMRATIGKFGAIAYDAGNSRWNKRGWTLQETQLSTRKLMFGAERMYFDCGVRFWIENMRGFLTQQIWSRPFLHLLFEDLGLNPKNFHFAWYGVVGEYSHRDLAYPTDRLPAISGLAQIMHGRMAGIYLAGLWQSDLFDGFLWIRPPWDRPAMSGATFIDCVVHPNEYIAPSWSWAGSKKEVFYVCRVPPHPKNASEIEILEATTALIGSNPFGGVRDGHLLLRGRTLRLKGAWIFGVDGNIVEYSGWTNGNMWLEVISHKGFEIARCALDWQIPEAAKDFELCEAPWDQLMMMIVASHSIDGENWENDENEEYREEVEEEEDEEAVEDEINEINESIESDDNIDFGDEERKSERGEEDDPDGKDNSPEERRDYFGLLLLPTTREADSWVRVGVCMLRSDIHGRTVLDNCSEKIVKLV